MVPQNLTTAKQTGASEWRGKNVFRRRKIFNTKKKRQSSSSVARHGSSGQISRSPSFPSLAGFSQQRFGHGNSHPSRREVWWLWLQGGCSEVHAISGHIVRHLRVAPCGGVPCPWGRGTETMPQGRTIGRKSPGNGPSYWSKRARDRGCGIPTRHTNTHIIHPGASTHSHRHTYIHMQKYTHTQTQTQTNTKKTTKKTTSKQTHTHTHTQRDGESRE